MPTISEKREKYGLDWDHLSQRLGPQKVELHALRTQMVPVDRLKPNEYNPNRQDEREFELLCRSIERHGFTMPILANADGTIIDGEHRWLAARRLGLKEVPVIFLDMDEMRMRLATIRHNKARGEHDVDLEAAVLQDLVRLMGEDFVKTELGLVEDELRRLLEVESALDLFEDEDFSEAWEGVTQREAKENVEQPYRVTVGKGADVGIRADAVSQSVQERLRDALKVGAPRPRVHQVSAMVSADWAADVLAWYEEAPLPGETPADKFLFLAREYLRAHGELEE